MLYQNADKTVMLIDIPASIMYAQGYDLYHSENILSSTAPPTVPFPITNDPAKGGASQINNHDAIYHREIRQLIHDAIEEVKSSHRSISEWCLPRRWICQTKHPTSKKRKCDDGEGKEGVNSECDADGNQAKVSDFQEHIAFKDDTKETKRRLKTGMTTTEPCILTNIPQNGILYQIHQTYNRIFHNPRQEMLSLSIIFLSNSDHPPQKFHIPIHSTFLLASIQDSIFRFKSAVLQLLPSSPRGQFDFILLDPPWPNASAKRARSYQRPRSLQDTSELLSSIQLEDHIAPEGYLGVWMTNKPAIRELLLTHLFEQWDLVLVEEWIWIKTTVHGEPITDLDSAWRKPYEIMLLGKRRQCRGQEQQQQQKEKMASSVTLKRRIIAGVPDLHSRKPSLKALVESVLFVDAGQYRALEVFARHLTAGWWAWGDEVLKFNWEGASIRREVE